LILVILGILLLLFIGLEASVSNSSVNIFSSIYSVLELIMAFCVVGVLLNLVAYLYNFYMAKIII
jgi:hypothetical protein